MLKTKMGSLMKWTKDRVKNPIPLTAVKNLIAREKDTGATHVEIAVPLGMPESVGESLRWANEIHSAGLSVTWRPAHVNMEKDGSNPTGLYGFPLAVGVNRRPQGFYISEAKNFILNNPSLFKDGDEWAPYPERTEGIWTDATAWIWPNDAGTYATFFITLADESATAFQTIGKNVSVGLSANNGSELISGWMRQSLIDRAGYVVMDHYVDGNPTQLEADLRAVKARYGKPIYLQETAPHRSIAPTQAQIDAYFASLTRLVADGTIEKIGYWGLWSGTAEGALDGDETNGFTLNAKGFGLKSFFSASPTPIPVPTPAPSPVPTPTPTPPADYTPIVNAIDRLNNSMSGLTTLTSTQGRKLERISQSANGAGTATVKITAIKAILLE